ncbi:MAG: NADH-quinone oxidoreductase subunit NuoH [Chloroflexi bacterium]|nr:NADH-quinone oxidoreductase subunit NuoH [Chloroflexota bacterium]
MNTVLDSVVFKFIYCMLVSSDECANSFKIIGSGFISEKYAIIGFLITAFFLIFIIVNGALVGVLALIWGERRLVGRFQARLGPNRWGPWGIFTPVADAIKVMFKEDISPTLSDKFVFILAPILMVVPVLMIFAVIPFGEATFLTDLNVGVLFVLAITSTNTLSVLMAGWGSGNRYGIIGGLRAVAMLLSYEIPMALAAVGVILMAGSLSIIQVIESQVIPYAIFQPLGFLTFLIASTAELNRSPFDITEAESELIAGYMTEYSSMKFGLFYLGEFMATIASSAIIVCLFLGGWKGPEILPSHFWFMIKWILMICVFIWFRATFPRLRVDQIMELAWKGLFELTLINILSIAILMLIWPDPSITELWIMTGIKWIVFFVSLWIFGKLLGPKPLQKNGVARKIVLQK